VKSEPIAILELVRLIAVVAGAIGIVVTPDEQAVLAAGITGAIAAISIIIAVVQRMSVFSPKTTQKLVNRAAATQNTDIGDPPSGDTGPASG
jgi:hypothetical protein